MSPEEDQLTKCCFNSDCISVEDQLITETGKVFTKPVFSLPDSVYNNNIPPLLNFHTHTHALWLTSQVIVRHALLLVCFCVTVSCDKHDLQWHCENVSECKHLTELLSAVIDGRHLALAGIQYLCCIDALPLSCIRRHVDVTTESCHRSFLYFVLKCFHKI